MSSLATAAPVDACPAGTDGRRDEDHRARAVAALLLAGGAMGMAAPALGAGVWWGTPMALLAAGIVKLGPRTPSFAVRAGIAAGFVAWLLLALLLAGLPPDALTPGNLGSTAAALRDAFLTMAAPGAGDVWTLAAWLAVSGFAWYGGALQTVQPGRPGVAIGFFMLCGPLATALFVLKGVEDAPWPGAVVLAAALLWATRSELRAALPAVGAVAVAAIAISAAAGPEEPWIDPTPFRPDFSRLDRDQTYGPLQDDRRGATMFTVQSPAAALWRSQVLDIFDGRGWVSGMAGGDDRLPQPAGVAVTTTVTVADMRDEVAVAPGRVLSGASGGVEGQSVDGEAFLLSAPPATGERYTVISQVVPPDRDRIANVAIPVGQQYTRYKGLMTDRPRDLGTPLIAKLDEMSASERAAPMGRVYALAGELARGAPTQLAVVDRVQAYLRDPKRFEYSLDVPRAGPEPLADFLLETQRGYCQHFAGAAALLLRLAGVPVRVAVGFGTGEPAGPGTWEVRDKEAHAWIEVYFPRTGWVPFDPTPPDTEASIAAEASVPPDPMQLGGTAGTTPDAATVAGPPVVGIAALALLAVAGVAGLLWWRRRHPRPVVSLGDALARLAPAPVGPGRTLSELRSELAQLGPAVAALGDEAEAQRFGQGGGPAEEHPRRRVMRALVQDVGWWGTVRLLVLGPGRRPVVDERAPRAVAGPSKAPPPAGPRA